MPADSAVAEAIRRTISEKGWIELPSHGTSMYPLITQGSICRFCPAESLPKKGEIYLYLSNSGDLVGHRLHHTVFEENRMQFVCKGDSNRSMDAPIANEQIIGKLTEVRRKRIRMKAKHPLAILWGKLILHIPLLTTCIHYYLGFKRKHSPLKNRIT